MTLDLHSQGPDHICTYGSHTRTAVITPNSRSNQQTVSRMLAEADSEPPTRAATTPIAPYGSTGPEITHSLGAEWAFKTK